MAYLLIGTQPPKDYETFFMEAMEELRKCKIRGVAIVAMPEDASDEVLTGFWQMDVCDRTYAAEHLRMDAMDLFIRNNIKRYLAEADEDE